MKNILPPYGVILRNAMQTGDRELMQAFLKYSDFMRRQGLEVSAAGQADWDAAHSELERAVG